MAVISDIEIRLRADIARLQQDMTQARNAVGGAMTSIRNAVGGAATAIAGLAAAAGVGLFASWIKGAIDAVDAIGDISPATGVAIKDIAGLQLAFQFGGLEAKAMEASMIKLSTAISKNDDTLSALRISTVAAGGDLRASKDVLYDVADAFAAMEDGTRKTALATELFGKTGAALIPMLNGGADGLRQMAEMADKLGLTYDEQTVEAAGQFNDTLDYMGLASQGVARQLAAQLLPTLNAVSGSFLNLIVEGDGVRRAADVIGTGFKIIYTGAIAVGEVFNTLSSIIAISLSAVLDGFKTVGKTMMLFIQGEYKAAWEAASGGARAATANIKNLAGDMTKSWSASANAIGSAWTGSSSDVVAAMAATVKSNNAAVGSNKDLEKATKAAQKAQADAARAAERNAEAYARLVGSIEDRIAATGREAAGLKPLTESERMLRDLEKELAAGKLDLNGTQLRYLNSLIETVAVNEQIIDQTRQQVEDEKEWVKIREQVAEAQAASAERDLAQQQEFWSSIDDTARETFRSIQDGGAALGQRLRDTLKNTFFDWLYQMTMKKWIVNIQGAFTGAGAAGGAGAGGGLSSLIGAATSGNGIMGAVGNLYSSLAGGATLGGGLGTGFLGSLAGGLNGAGIGSGLTSSLGLSIGNSVAGALGPTISGALSSGLGAIATAMPWVAGAAALLTIGKKAFGRGPKETTGTGITGTFGEAFMGDAYTEWQKKGGWFRSTKRGTDTGPMSAEMSGGINDAYRAMRESAAMFADALGVPASTIDGYSKQIKLSFSGDSAKDQAALEAILADVGDELATRVLPNIAAFIREGETAAATLQRLATEFQTVGAVLKSIGLVGDLALEARTRLVEMSGGLEAFATQADYFAQNFLTDAQRLAPAQAQVTAGLAALGMSSITTVEQFAAAVTGLSTSGALATEAGAKTFAGLMALAPAFKQVADAAQLAAAASEEAARAAREAATDALRGAAQTAFDALQKSIGAQKGNLLASFDELMGRLDKRIDRSTQRLGQLESLRSAVGGAASALGGGMDRQAAQAQIAATLAIARSTGMLPKADALQDALRAVQQDAGNQFSSLVDFQRDQLRTANQLEELGAITGRQITVEERTLAALQDQRKLLQDAYGAEVARLDSLVASAQAQLGAINGTTMAVMDLQAAMQQFGGAVNAALKDRTIAGQSSITPETRIEGLYNSLLGRGSDAAGLKYWADLMRGGASLDTVRNGFLQSTEYQSRVYSGQQGGTMAGSGAVVTELQTLNSRMANMENAMKKTADSTTQFASQFDNASAGGSYLLTAPA